jgi:hypothetical protein
MNNTHKEYFLLYCFPQLSNDIIKIEYFDYIFNPKLYIPMRIPLFRNILLNLNIIMLK